MLGERVADTILSVALAWSVRHEPSGVAAPRATPFPSSFAPTLDDSARAGEAISRWPEYAVSPLRSAPSMAKLLGVGELWLKDESDRLGTGSFKALGGGYAVDELVRAADGSAPVFATASAGNHGVGVAWACRRLGAACHVYLSEGVSDFQAERIRSLGGTVHRVVGTYEDSLSAARQAADAAGWQIVQDVSWEGNTRVPALIYAGYTVLAAEIVEQLAAADAPPPTHVLVNAGVGGLAVGVCAHLWARYGAARPTFITVEAQAADCLLHSARLGSWAALPPERIAAESTIMTGLDCNTPDQICWEVLHSGVDHFVAVGDEVVAPCVRLLAEELDPPIAAGDSAVAGLGVLVAAAAQPAVRERLGLTEESRVAIIVCEGAFAA